MIGNEKFFKVGLKWGVGGCGARGLTFFLFNFFIINYLSFLHLEITLSFTKLCYAFEEELFFSVTIIL